MVWTGTAVADEQSPEALDILGLSDGVASSALVPSVDRAALSLLGLNSAASSSRSEALLTPWCAFGSSAKFPDSQPLTLVCSCAKKPLNTLLACTFAVLAAHVRAFEADQRHWRQWPRAPKVPSRSVTQHFRRGPATQNHLRLPELAGEVSHCQSYSALQSLVSALCQNFSGQDLPAGLRCLHPFLRCR